MPPAFTPTEPFGALAAEAALTAELFDLTAPRGSLAVEVTAACGGPGVTVGSSATVMNAATAEFVSVTEVDPVAPAVAFVPSARA